jgi:GT2 family glycosyltransferase
LSLSIVIPTYERESVLLDTVKSLLALEPAAAEILLIDQTKEHRPETTQQLLEWEAAGHIRWIRREIPGIPQAMNAGLLAAKENLVLFLDDDIVPDPGLLAAHLESHRLLKPWAVVGQVIQPWQTPQPEVAPRKTAGLRVDFDFPFHSTISAPVRNVMAGNLSVDREKAISIGGFDEQFCGSAYRFETEFARRINNAVGQIWFCGDAGIRHLRVPAGGTRQKGDHRTSADPRHGVGDHYFALRHGTRPQAFFYQLHRMLREVMTRFHLSHPWYIPVKLLGEFRAWRLARGLCKAGPKLIPASSLPETGSPDRDHP